MGKHISSFVYFRSDDEAEDSTLGLVKDAAAQVRDQNPEQTSKTQIDEIATYRSPCSCGEAYNPLLF